MDFKEIRRIVADEVPKGDSKAKTAKDQLDELIESTKNYNKVFPGQFSGNYVITKECKAKYDDLRKLFASVKDPYDNALLELECLLHMRSALDQQETGLVRTFSTSREDSDTALKGLLIWAKQELGGKDYVSKAEKELDTLGSIATLWDRWLKEKPVMKLHYRGVQPSKSDEKFKVNLAKIIEKRKKVSKSDKLQVKEAEDELKELLRKHVAYHRLVKTNDSKTPEVKRRKLARRKENLPWHPRQSYRGSVLVVETETKRIVSPNTDTEDTFPVLRRSNNRRRDEQHESPTEDLIDSLEKENKSLKEEVNKKSHSSAFEDLRRENAQLQLKVDELTTRLSSLASKHLTDGNPNITDLSDRNRPTKIAEKFGGLYDDEWTDALDDLLMEPNSTEQKAFADLCNMLFMAYEFCKKVSVRQLKDLTLQMEQAMTNVKYEQDGKSTEIYAVEESARHFVPADRYAREWRKTSALSSVPALSVIFKEQICKGNQLDPYKYPNVEVYIDKCIELTWLMVVQKPQMDIQTARPDTNVDTDVFKFYMKKGKVVEMTVWPAVFLYEGGPIISKGFVLPK